MPKISEFLGIIIAMFYDDHNPPHFHAIYNEYKATFTIESLELLEGELPRRVVSLVLEWAFLHRDELKREWKLAGEHKPLFWIEPLK
ncbi:DUF4160 domain-containing protein [candidate division WOR-3 bacterium]|nr:DUF4160 domain-containing protein [candidate division WOR-3 bacterium]